MGVRAALVLRVGRGYCWRNQMDETTSIERIQLTAAILQTFSSSSSRLPFWKRDVSWPPNDAEKLSAVVV
jgi:hypothetical protein